MPVDVERALSTPLVSIGVPVYNGGSYLEASLRSLLAQTHTNIELVISDNASTDGSSEVCQEIARQDARVKYVRLPENIGGVRNHNKARELASGEFFMWGSCDDLWKPQYVERCLAVLMARPEVVLAYSLNARIDENSQSLADIPPGPTLDRASVFERFTILSEIDTPIEPFYGLIRRSALDRTAMFTLHPGFDRILLAELGLMGPMVQVPEALYCRRIHQQQSIHAYPGLKARYRWINPASKGKLVWPNFAYAWHFGGAVLRSAPGISGRAACLYHLVRWCNWHRKVLWEDIKGAA